MFESYNGLARRALFFARHAASQSGCPAIETEHLLLGLVREGGPLVARLVPTVSLEELRVRIPRKIVDENPAPRMHMPLTTECKRILGYSAEEANGLDHGYIGVEHLLLGLLREKACRAALVLSELGVHLEELRRRLVQVSPQSTATKAESTVVKGTFSSGASMSD